MPALGNAPGCFIVGAANARPSVQKDASGSHRGWDQCLHEQSRFCVGKCLALGAALALGMVTLTVPASAADFVMKFGTATMNETQHQFIKFYKEEVEKASGGRIEVQIYPASQLGPIPREIEGVQLGSVQGYIGPVDFFVGVDPRFGVFWAPMLFRDDANAAATVQDPAIQKAMFDMAGAEAHGRHRHLEISARPTTAPRRRSCGLRISAARNCASTAPSSNAQKMAKLGATGIGMPLSEVVPALDQGTIDGTISGLSVFVAFKMNDLLKVITVTNDTYIISIAVVSKPWLDTLPPDLQKIVHRRRRGRRRPRRSMGMSTSPRSWWTTGPRSAARCTRCPPTIWPR